MKIGRFVLAMISVLAVLALAWSVRVPGIAPTSDAAVNRPGVEPVVELAGGADALPAAAATPVATAEPTEPRPEVTEQATEEAAPDLTTTGLKKLQSFRSNMNVTWNGTKSDKPTQGYLKVNYAVERKSPAYEMYMESAGLDPANAETVSKVAFVQVADKMWFYQSDSDSWMQVPAGDMDIEDGYFNFSPADMLPGFDKNIEAARNSTPETVNGVAAYKYTFTEKELESANIGAVASAKGEAWVAVDGDYIVTLTLEAQVEAGPNESMFDKGAIKMDYAVTDINQPITIEPPAEAMAQSKAREDIPLLTDAEMQFSTPDMMSYVTQGSVADAAKFYETEMPKNGWEAATAENTSLEDMVLLNYTKGGDKVFIMVSKDQSGKGTSVMITVESASKETEVQVEPTEATEVATETTEEATVQVTPPPDVPLMLDAKLSPDSAEGYIVYTTSASIAEIEAFYQNEMPVKGWEPEKDNNLASKGYIDYYKDGGKGVVNIYVTEDGGTATVEIFITYIE